MVAHPRGWSGFEDANVDVPKDYKVMFILYVLNLFLLANLLCGKKQLKLVFFWGEMSYVQNIKYSAKMLKTKKKILLKSDIFGEFFYQQALLAYIQSIQAVLTSPIAQKYVFVFCLFFSLGYSSHGAVSVLLWS